MKLIIGPGLNLQILVSCFVKTPHFEEYLRVKASISQEWQRV
jgi:hypothetical protein